jgi:hypothetical protein
VGQVDEELMDHIDEKYRHALGVRLLDHLSRDVRLAVRALLATPLPGDALRESESPPR